MRSFLRSAILLLSLFISLSSHAKNWTYNGAGNWADPSNWKGGQYPGITVVAGDTVFVDAQDGVCRVYSLQLNGVLVVLSFLQNYGIITGAGKSVILVQATGKIYNMERSSMTVKSTVTVAGFLGNTGNFELVGVNGNSTGVIKVLAGGGLYNTGTMTNNGFISNAGHFYNANNCTLNNNLIFQNEIGSNFDNAGTIIQPRLSSLSTGMGSTFLNEETGMIQSDGIITFDTDVRCTNNGTMANTYMINSNATFINNGHISTAYSFSNLNNGDSSRLTNAGTINVLATTGTYPSTLEATSGLYNTATGTINLAAGTRLLNLDSLVNAGTLTVAAGALFVNNQVRKLSGTVVNKGSLQLNGTCNNMGVFSNYGTMLIAGQFNNQPGASLLNWQYSITIGANGTLENLAGATVVNMPLTGPLPARAAPAPPNYGIIVNNGTFTNNGSFTNNASFGNTGEFQNQGYVLNRMQVINTGVIVNQDSLINTGGINNEVATSLINYFSGYLQGYSDPYSNYAITSQPASKSVNTGGTTSFTVTATGPNISYQWLVATNGSNWENVPNNTVYSGGTTATLTISNAPASANGYRFQVILSGPQNGNLAFSQLVTLIVGNGK
jgi:hypothetical protein